MFWSLVFAHATRIPSTEDELLKLDRHSAASDADGMKKVVSCELCRMALTVEQMFYGVLLLFYICLYLKFVMICQDVHSETANRVFGVAANF